jgi:glycosyltransferase involved in cell wall biosynthesis/2-polyprenyl-3-methyl-5-hydroxy-6-metoxy-1,4-benzoquinol methylase
MLANPVKATISLSGKSYLGLSNILTKNNINLIISNTLDSFDGALAAVHIGIPHIWYVHEIIDRSDELRSVSVANNTYSKWMNELADHVLFCSYATQKAYILPNTKYASSILAPYQSPKNSITKKERNNQSCIINIFFIGSDSRRKNPEFAVEVVKALQMRGNNVHLTFIGFSHDRSSRLDFLVRRRGISKNVSYLGYVSDPYIFMKGKAINLIAATCEPFGLTAVECLARGIPVVAPDLDGPSELLIKKNLFQLGDVVKCTKIIESIFSNYHISSQEALDCYNIKSREFTFEYQSTVVIDAIDSTLKGYRIKSIPRAFQQEVFHDALFNTNITSDAIKTSIHDVTSRSLDDLNSAIAFETKFRGYSVTKNVKYLDVVPFQYSYEMENLYKYGDGFYLELLANIHDASRLSMAGTIILRLLTEYSSDHKPIVLAVGDGIGLDTIRIATAGFNVDYMDVESSLTSSIACKLFENHNSKNNPNYGIIRTVNFDDISTISYDSIICLEVIEHVDDPSGFLKFLSSKLSDQGLLYISDCFNGIRDEYPTHLQKNENLSGLLHLLAALNGLYFEGFSRTSRYKPYIFRKLDSIQNPLIIKSLISSDFIDLIIKEQSKVRIPDMTGLSNMISIIRAIRHLFVRCSCRLYSNFIERQK